MTNLVHWESRNSLQNQSFCTDPGRDCYLHSREQKAASSLFRKPGHRRKDIQLYTKLDGQMGYAG